MQFVKICCLLAVLCAFNAIPADSTTPGYDANYGVYDQPPQTPPDYGYGATAPAYYYTEPEAPYDYYGPYYYENPQPLTCPNPASAVSVPTGTDYTFIPSDFPFPTPPAGSTLSLLTVTNAPTELQYNGFSTSTMEITIVGGSSLYGDLVYLADGVSAGTTVTFSYSFTDTNQESQPLCTMTINVVAAGQVKPRQQKIQEMQELAIDTTSPQFTSGLTFGIVIGSIAVIALEVVAYTAYCCWKRRSETPVIEDHPIKTVSITIQAFEPTEQHV